MSRYGSQGSKVSKEQDDYEDEHGDYTESQFANTALDPDIVNLTTSVTDALASQYGLEVTHDPHEDITQIDRRTTTPEPPSQDSFERDYVITDKEVADLNAKIGLLQSQINLFNATLAAEYYVVPKEGFEALSNDETIEGTTIKPTSLEEFVNANRERLEKHLETEEQDFKRDMQEFNNVAPAMTEDTFLAGLSKRLKKLNVGACQGKLDDIREKVDNTLKTNKSLTTITTLLNTVTSVTQEARESTKAVLSHMKAYSEEIPNLRNGVERLAKIEATRNEQIEKYESPNLYCTMEILYKAIRQHLSGTDKMNTAYKLVFIKGILKPLGACVLAEDDDEAFRAIVAQLPVQSFSTGNVSWDEKLESLVTSCLAQKPSA